MRRAAGIMILIRDLTVLLSALTAGTLVILYLFGNRFYIVRSGSMEPAVCTGDLAIVNCRYDYDRLSVGDIITYKAGNGALVTHRIISISDDGLETMGDANSISDGIAADRENYLGKEWLALPKLGYLSSAALSTRGRILIVTAAAVLMIITLFPADSRKQRKGETQREKNA